MQPSTSDRRARIVRRALLIGGPLVAAGLVLFPFDWLGNVWPAYRAIFDVVFATPLSHIIGHAALFGLTGLLLLALPLLRARPAVYLAIMAAGALAEEAIQALAKRSWPTWWDARDLALDLVGSVVALLLVLAVRQLVRQRHVAATTKSAPAQ